MAGGIMGWKTKTRMGLYGLCGGLLAFTGVLSPLCAEQAHAEAEITQAQPELPTIPLTITGQDGHQHVLTVEVARTQREQEVGEMFRKVIPSGHGMLFVWPAPERSAMWMRNTFVPLDIIFIDEQHRIHSIEEHTVPLSEGIISSHGVVAAALEVPAGTAAQLGLLVGDTVSASALTGGQN